jgi:hypothetical protein
VSRRWIVAVAVGAAGSVAAGSTAAAAKTCQPPKHGFHSCLRVHYAIAEDSSVRVSKVTATLLHPVAECADRAGRRTVVIRADSTRVDSKRRRGTCRHGVERWQIAFTRSEAANWGLMQGMRVVAAWKSAHAENSVMLVGSPGA